MAISDARYTNAQRTVIAALIDGRNASIPVDAGNADYRELLSGGIAITDYAAPPAPLPDVSKRQILLWLLSIGKSEADVVAALGSIADLSARSRALIDWSYPDGPFSRTNPMFDQLGPQFGLTSEQLDAAFVAAAVL